MQPSSFPAGLGSPPIMQVDGVKYVLLAMENTGELLVEKSIGPDNVPAVDPDATSTSSTLFSSYPAWIRNPSISARRIPGDKIAREHREINSLGIQLGGNFYSGAFCVKENTPMYDFGKYLENLIFSQRK